MKTIKVDRRGTAGAIIGIALALSIWGCSRVNYVPASRIERIVDTVTRVEPDSSLLKALFACDSLGQVYVRELSEIKGKEASQEVSFVGGELRVETRWRTQFIERINEVHDTTTVVQEVEIPCDGHSCAAAVELRHKGIPAFFWVCFAIAFTSAAYLIYRIIRLLDRSGRLGR